MYVFVYKDTFQIHIYGCIHLFIYSYIHIYTYINAFIYIPMHTHTYSHIYVHTCIYTYLYTCIPIYIYTGIGGEAPPLQDNYGHGCHEERSKWRMKPPSGKMLAVSHIRAHLRVHAHTPKRSLCHHSFFSSLVVPAC